MYTTMKVDDLKLELKSRELSTTGAKTDLVGRILEDDYRVGNPSSDQLKVEWGADDSSKLVRLFVDWLGLRPACPCGLSPDGVVWSRDIRRAPLYTVSTWRGRPRPSPPGDSRATGGRPGIISMMGWPDAGALCQTCVN
jgi:hypothetical protein